MQRIRSLVRRGYQVVGKSKILLIAVGAVGVSLLASGVRADDPVLMAPTDLVSAFATNTTPYANAIVPVVLGLFGLFLALGILMGWGKRSTH